MDSDNEELLTATSDLVQVETPRARRCRRRYRGRRVRPIAGSSTSSSAKPRRRLAGLAAELPAAQYSAELLGLSITTAMLTVMIKPTIGLRPSGDETRHAHAVALILPAPRGALALLVSVVAGTLACLPIVIGTP